MTLQFGVPQKVPGMKGKLNSGLLHCSMKTRQCREIHSHQQASKQDIRKGAWGVFLQCMLYPTWQIRQRSQALFLILNCMYDESGYPKRLGSFAWWITRNGLRNEQTSSGVPPPWSPFRVWPWSPMTTSRVSSNKPPGPDNFLNSSTTSCIHDRKAMSGLLPAQLEPSVIYAEACLECIPWIWHRRDQSDD